MAKQKNPLDEVKDLYLVLPIKEVAKITGFNERKIRNLATKMKLKRVNRFWNEKEKKLLLKYYEYGIAFVLEKLPGRTKWGIINQYRELTGKRNG